MGRTVAELKASISRRELQEWMEFYALEPWGSEIDWFRTGTIAAVVANSAPNRKRGSKAMSPKDFMPKFGRKRRGDLNPDRLKAELLSGFGKRIKRAKKNEN
jgi:hypothetical protein